MFSRKPNLRRNEESAKGMTVINNADCAVIDACTLNPYLKSVQCISATGARKRYRFSDTDFRYRKPAPEAGPFVIRLTETRPTNNGCVLFHQTGLIHGG